VWPDFWKLENLPLHRFATMPGVSTGLPASIDSDKRTNCAIDLHCRVVEPVPLTYLKLKVSARSQHCSGMRKPSFVALAIVLSNSIALARRPLVAATCPWTGR
jgi:hypothetical protein